MESTMRAMHALFKKRIALMNIMLGMFCNIEIMLMDEYICLICQSHNIFLIHLILI